jgi:hypothetical protein
MTLLPWPFFRPTKLPRSTWPRAVATSQPGARDKPLNPRKRRSAKALRTGSGMSRMALSGCIGAFMAEVKHAVERWQSINATTACESDGSIAVPPPSIELHLDALPFKAAAGAPPPRAQTARPCQNPAIQRAGRKRRPTIADVLLSSAPNALRGTLLDVSNRCSA